MFFFNINRQFKKEKLGPEQKECVVFANQLTQWTLNNQLKAIWFHPSNEISTGNNWGYGTQLKLMGKINGVPDYVLCWENGSAFIEFKAPGKKLSPNQKLFQNWCNDNKVFYKICFSSKEAEEFVKTLGVLNAISKD